MSGFNALPLHLIAQIADQQRVGIQSSLCEVTDLPRNVSGSCGLNDSVTEAIQKDQSWEHMRLPMDASGLHRAAASILEYQQSLSVNGGLAPHFVPSSSSSLLPVERPCKTQKIDERMHAGKSNVVGSFESSSYSTPSWHDIAFLCSKPDERSVAARQPMFNLESADMQHGQCYRTVHHNVPDSSCAEMRVHATSESRSSMGREIHCLQGADADSNDSVPRSLFNPRHERKSAAGTVSSEFAHIAQQLLPATAASDFSLDPLTARYKPPDIPRPVEQQEGSKDGVRREDPSSDTAKTASSKAAKKKGRQAKLEPSSRHSKYCHSCQHSKSSMVKCTSGRCSFVFCQNCLAQHMTESFEAAVELSNIGSWLCPCCRNMCCCCSAELCRRRHPHCKAYRKRLHFMGLAPSRLAAAAESTTPPRGD